MPVTDPTYAIVDCPVCHGSGEVEAHVVVRGWMIDPPEGEIIACRKCGGSGRVEEAIDASEVRESWDRAVAAWWIEFQTGKDTLDKRDRDILESAELDSPAWIAEGN